MENENQPQEAEILDNTQTEGLATQGEETNAELLKYKAIAERKTRQLEEAKKFLQEKDEATTPSVKQGDDERIAELEFKLENPELKDELDLIKTFAKGKGITLQEAAKDEKLLNLIGAQKEKAGVSVINSNNKITAHASETAKKRQEMMSKGTTEALAEYLTETGVE